MMRSNKFVLALMLAVMLFVQGFVSVEAQQAKKTQPVKQKVVQPIVAPVYMPADALDIVNNPNAYLGKFVTIKASFNKFTTLGLDYKPVFRSSQDYITFLINRSNTPNIIPLSEMKIFIKRTDAEKFIDLDSGDIIEFNAKVVSSALSDPWLEVASLKIIEKKTKPKK